MDTELKFIEPVECALAVIGVEPILSKEVEKIKVADVKEMVGLGRSVYAEAKAVVNGAKSSVPLIAVNYKKLLKELTEEYNIGQLEQMVSTFPLALQEISGDFLLKAQEVVKLLESLLPKAQKQTLLGPENIMPPALAIRKFATLLDVLDDPMRVFAHISAGSLLKSQAQVVQHVYPTFSEAVTDAFEQAGTDAKAKVKSFSLPARVEIGYCNWKGEPRISPALQSKLQANFAKSAAEKPKPAGDEGTSTSVAAKEAMTQTQKAAFPMKG